ncbi:porin family protein [Pontibacter indicus]|uniref:Probable protein-translocating porin PorT n=1 Tax=Pontibacter indicus TaxID=1317125 RepID=A0A1R3XKZ8_9BACT|nr:porin family protein [Pontibacter indicus]SIT92333.1 probable protein-translocating porin PorT [Pontibacter indicus]
MAFTHIWHQLHLHRQKISFAVLFLICLAGTTQVQAQTQKVKGENKPGYDEKRIHYGFYLGMSYSKYYIEHSQAYADQAATGTQVNTLNELGFYPGLVLNVRLLEYLDARFVPGVGFYGRSIDFERRDTPEGEGGNFDNTTFASPVIELPVLLKYRAKRRGNFRMYMVGGVKASRVLGNTTHTQNRDLLRINRNDLSIDYGVGLDIFYPYFKFAPELRFSHGLMNQKSNSGGEYSPLIDRMTTRNVSLIFHFE